MFRGPQPSHPHAYLFILEIYFMTSARKFVLHINYFSNIILVKGLMSKEI